MVNSFPLSFRLTTFLYGSIFDIFLLSKLNQEPNKNNKQLAEDVYNLSNLIIRYLKEKPKIHMNDVAEEHRWSFLMIALGHVVYQLHLYKLVEDVQPF